MGNDGNQKGESIYMKNKKEINANDNGMKKADTKETKEPIGGKIAYAGPTITGVVTSNTVFSNGIPAVLAAAIEEMPSLGKLLVPISRFPAALSEINNKQGAMHIFYEYAKQYRPKKGV